MANYEGITHQLPGRRCLHRHSPTPFLPMQSKLCPHCHSGGRARLAAPCRDACDLLLMVMCRATGLSRVPVRSRPTTRSLAHVRATALAHVQRVCCAHALGSGSRCPGIAGWIVPNAPKCVHAAESRTSRLLAHAPVMGQTCRCPSAIAVGSVRSGATQAAVTADAYRCASRRAQVTAPCVCDDLECAREDHWEMTWTGLWSVNATRQTRGDLCPFTLFAMLF